MCGEFQVNVREDVGHTINIGASKNTMSKCTANKLIKKEIFNCDSTKRILIAYLVLTSNKTLSSSNKTRQIWGIWKLRPAYSPGTPNLGQNRWCFVLCDLEIWWMTLENNRASLLCCFKLCATFHSHWWIQTGVTVRKRPIWVKFDDF